MLQKSRRTSLLLASSYKLAPPRNGASVVASAAHKEGAVTQHGRAVRPAMGALGPARTTGSASPARHPCL